MGRWWSRAIALVVCLGGMAIGTSSADAALYWTMQGAAGVAGIGRVDVDGNHRVDMLVQTDDGPTGIATDDHYVYWTNRAHGTIGRARLDGSDPRPSFVVPGGSPKGIAVDGDHIYWGDEDTQLIHRADVETGAIDDPATFAIQATGDPDALTLDDTHLYWTNSGASIGRAELDGSNVLQSLTTDVNPRFGLALDGGSLYFSAGGSIGRADLDGGNATNELIPFSAGFGPTGVAAHGGVVYWVDDDFPGDSTLYQASAVDGSNAAILAPTLPNAPWGLAYGPLLGRLAADPAPSFPDTVVGQTSATQTVTFSNDGERPVAIDEPLLTGAGAGQFEIVGQDCTAAPLAVGDDCTVTVRFAPDASGLKTATLRLPSDATDGPNALDVALGATALARPAVAVGPAPSFPDQAVGTVGPSQPVTVTNAGGSDLAITELALDGDDAAEFQLDFGTCDDGPIAAGASCEASLRFAPATAGAKSAQLRVDSNGVSTPDTLPLSATAVTPAALAFGAAPEFPAVVVGERSAPRTVAIANDGDLPLTIDAVEVVGTDAAQFEPDAEGCTAAPIPGGGSCEVAIRFAPTAAGTQTATLRVVSDAASSPDELPLSGVGVDPEPDPPTPPDPDPPTPPDPGPPAPPDPGPPAPPNPGPPVVPAPLPLPLAVVPEDVAPVAVATATRRSRASARVQRYLLDARGSRDADGPIVAYRWRIGGRTVGTRSRQLVPLAARTRPYAVTLTVTDARGGTASTRLTLRARVPRVVTATIPATVSFPIGSSYLGRTAERVVQRLRAQADGALRVRITGHSDDLGPAGYNRWLSERRARRVAATLLAGLPRRPAHVIVRGVGAADPIAPNTTPAGRAANRSVQLEIVTRG